MVQLATQKPPIGGKLRTSEIVYLHTDHLNSPRVGTDALGKVVWNWQSDAFGVSVASSTQGNKFLVNLRFPGQFFDTETGLYYNYHRYYNPQTGRYISSDPIGLAGGLNTYGYVGGNPLKYIDPTGHNALALPVICILNPHACITIAVTTCYTVYQFITEGIPQFIKVLNESCEGDDCADKARQKGERGKSTDDALEQLEEIEKAQKRYHQGKNDKKIDDITKSEQRAKNSLKPHNLDW